MPGKVAVAFLVAATCFVGARGHHPLLPNAVRNHAPCHHRQERSTHAIPSRASAPTVEMAVSTRSEIPPCDRLSWTAALAPNVVPLTTVVGVERQPRGP